MGFFFKQQRRCPLWFAVSLTLSLLGNSGLAHSQIIPDTTLPNNTVVIPNGNTSMIEGGTQTGGTLFHSFQEFSLPTGGVAFFNNAQDIQNIINRVTGGNNSNIDGLIRANGRANLFLINPNGIVFGPNAQLNIRGSFIGSTASSIKFADGSEFSATNPQAPPLLLINVPIGLQFGANPGSIINQSQATSPVPLPSLNLPIPIPSNVGLQVLPGQTLGLIGGDLILDSGNLTAFGGNIIVGSVASPGRVSFMPTPTGLALDYTGITNFGNIELSGIASINASGLGGGAIFVTGGSVTLSDDATVRADTLGSIDGLGIDIQAVQFKLQDRAFVSAGTVGAGAGGGITIHAMTGVELIGTGFENFRQTYLDATVGGTLNSLVQVSGLFTGTLSTGTGGDITIDTGQLTLRDGAVILSPTLNEGDGGSIAITASEWVEVIGSGLATVATAQGDAGTLTLNTGKLIVQDGAIVSTATFGSGTGGNISVTASELVEVSKTRPDSPVATSLSTSSIGGTGKAGDIEIHTRSLLLQEGGAITTSSGLLTADILIVAGGLGGNLTVNATESVQVLGISTNSYRSFLATGTGIAEAGNLTINTKRLIIQDGAAVGASTGDSGQGGDVYINASELVEVSGDSSDGRSPSILATASGDAFVSFFFPINPTGSAGNLSINTGKLIVRDGASVNVTSFGSGDAGTLNVVADAIAVDNQGSIDASTRSGEGGNIVLTAPDIRLRRGSQIRTDAGSSDGGNITIDTNTLVAMENSDITANAQQGSGGRVSITASGIFGTQFREQVTPESDITATSNLGLQFSGTVEIDIRGIDPSHGLVQLPENFVEPSRLIATSCAANAGNSFTLTGRGGLPEDPTATLRGQTVWRDLRLTRRSRGDSPTTNHQLPIIHSPSPLPTFPRQLVEANGWVINAEGQVELVAHSPKDTSHSPWFIPATCSQSG